MENKVLSSSLTLTSPFPATAVASVSPLNREDDDDEVRALAAALAPSILETEEILQVPAEFRTTTTDSGINNDGTDETYDDDDLDDEVDALRSSEALLRQELEMAQDFSSLFQFTHISVNDDEAGEITSYNDNTKEKLPDVTEQGNSDQILEHKGPDWNHDDIDDREAIGVDESLTPIKLKPERTSSKATTPNPKKLSHIDDATFLLIHPSPSLSLRRHQYSPMSYTIHDHQRVLLLRKEQHGGWYSVGIGRHFGIALPKDAASSTDSTNISTSEANKKWNCIYDNAVREYCLSIPASTLQKLFVGVSDRNTTSSTSSTTNDEDRGIVSTLSSPGHDHNKMRTEISFGPTTLPVRTITMQIRPDVLCGAVMEVVHQAFLEVQAQVTKRQGGHIQAVIPQQALLEKVEGVVNSVAFMIDVRLVTSKSEMCDRILLIRLFHYNCTNKDGVAADTIQTAMSTSNLEDEDGTSPINSNDILYENDVSLNIALHIREASALIQIMESMKDIKKRTIHGSTSSVLDLTTDEMTLVVSKHLLEHYRACPSVKDAGITLPSLNAEDFAIVKASGRLIQFIWEEIETRDLAYISLRSSRFGSFPSLPTLDVHYCSQLRRISREAMTAQLIKSASELEQYAREAELACANMITLLKPTFAVYGVEAPQLPKPKQLTEYPFDFVPSQVSCPPWGVKVQHALNEIQAWTGDANRSDAPNSQIFPVTYSAKYADDSIEMANAAVKLILEAFQKQDDDEQSARLGRKNIQVMDRLAMMQAHELSTIQTIQNCYNISEKALQAALTFQNQCGIREVPLLKWTIVVGRSTGTCTITANHILFVTKLIPVWGGSNTVVFNVDDIELIMEDNESTTTTILNPLPTIINVKQNRRTVYAFRPSTSAARLTSFFNVVKGAASRTLFDVSD